MKTLELESGFLVMIPERSYQFLKKIKASNKEKIKRDGLSERAQVIADTLVSHHLLNRDDEYYYALPFYEQRNNSMELLTESKRRSLKIINETLQREHNFDIVLDESIPVSTLKKIKDDVVNEQRELSYSEDPQSNPEYSQCALVLEAIDLLLGEKTQGSSFRGDRTEKTIFEHIDELTSMYKKIQETGGHTESEHPHAAKLKILEGKIRALTDRAYTESKEEEIRMMLKEDAQRAEVIMAAKGLLDTVQGFQTKIGDLMNKNLDPFIERVRTVYGSKTADEIYENIDGNLSELMSQVKASKEIFYDVVGMLSGDGTDMEGDMSGTEDESLPGLEDDDSIDDLGVQDEEGADVDGDDDDTFDLDLDSIDDEETFTRKDDE